MKQRYLTLHGPASMSVSQDRGRFLSRLYWTPGTKHLEPFVAAEHIRRLCRSVVSTPSFPVELN